PIRRTCADCDRRGREGHIGDESFDGEQDAEFSGLPAVRTSAAAEAEATVRASSPRRRGGVMKRLALTAVVLFASACASVPRDAGMSDIKQGVSARTGQTVEWKAAPSTADDPRIRELLRGELTADKAVAVAMANNPRLQATLAELGIARAELLQASV